MTARVQAPAPAGSDAPRVPWLVRLVMLAAIWGCSFLFIKVALEGMSDTQVVLGRLALGLLALAVVALARQERMPRTARLWGHLFLLGITANVIPFFCFSWGESHGATSGLAGIYNATTPLWTLLFSIAALPQERPTRARGIGLALGFVGVLVVLAPWQHVAGAKLGGQLACLAAGACYGISFTYTRRYVSGSGFSSLALATAQIGCATALMLVLTPLVATAPLHLNARVIASIVLLGAVGTGLAYLLYYGLIYEVGATTASTVTYLVPLLAVALGVLALGEHVGWNDFAGAAVVILGIAVAEGRLRRLFRRTPART